MNDKNYFTVVFRFILRRIVVSTSLLVHASKKIFISSLKEEYIVSCNKYFNITNIDEYIYNRDG